MKTYVGIDPGVQGGITIMRPDGVVLVNKMPDSLSGLNHLIKLIPKDAFCLMERVAAMPRQGAKSMFTFGQAVGHMEATLFAYGISTETVTPQKWQKHFQLGVKGGNFTASQWKKYIKDHAERLCPGVYMTQETADSVMIAVYARDKFSF